MTFFDTGTLNAILHQSPPYVPHPVAAPGIPEPVGPPTIQPVPDLIASAKLSLGQWLIYLRARGMR